MIASDLLEEDPVAAIWAKKTPHFPLAANGGRRRWRQPLPFAPSLSL
jgi:hypothetical protein